jgi:hypothetical protein
MGTKQITYKGKSIVYLDFTGMKNEDEIRKQANECASEIRCKPANSLYTVTNVTNMHFNNNIRDIFTDLARGNKPYVKAGAVVGLSGLASIVYNGLVAITKRDIKSFRTEEEALDYIAGK